MITPAVRQLSWKQRKANQLKTLLLLSTITTITASAVTVRFDDIDRPPSDSLNIGGVDVSVQFGQVSTKAGVGLGAGPDSLISFMVWYEPETGLVLSQDFRQYAIFVAPGPITGISLAPFTLPELPDELAGRWEIYASASVNHYPATMGSATCFLLDPNTGLDRDFYNPDDYPDLWANARTFSWGFSVLSLEYTPVPEPGTIALLGAGLLALWRGRRARKQG